MSSKYCKVFSAGGFSPGPVNNSILQVKFMQIISNHVRNEPQVSFRNKKKKQIKHIQDDLVLSIELIM